MYDEVSYNSSASTTIEWKHRGAYMQVRHKISPDAADEALSDEGRLVLEPDPSSRSGLSTRTIGWSASMGRLLTIITVDVGQGIVHGVNGWVSNSTDVKKYNTRSTTDGR